MSNQFLYLEAEQPIETYNGVDIYFNGSSHYAMVYDGVSQKSVELCLPERYDVKNVINSYMSESYFLALRDICSNFGIDPDCLHLYNGEEVVSAIKAKIKLEIQYTLDNLVG